MESMTNDELRITNGVDGAMMRGSMELIIFRHESRRGKDARKLLEECMSSARMTGATYRAAFRHAGLFHVETMS
jgi:hypothetical protein